MKTQHLIPILFLAVGIALLSGCGTSSVAADNPADTEYPTLVSVHMTNALPRDVLAELARQAGTEVNTTPASLLRDLNDPISIDAEREPFWKVALEICRKVHLTPAEVGGIGLRAITLQQGEEPAPRAVPTMLGCFHITPVSAISGGNVANRTILGFRMLVDPKLTVIRSTTFIRTTEVADSAGISLLYQAPFSPDALSTYYNWNWSLTSHILTPTSGSVAAFKGTVRTQVAEEMTLWDITNALAHTNLSRDLAFGKAAFGEIAKMDPRRMRALLLYDVYTVKASFDIAPGHESGLGGDTVFGGTVRLYDEAGLVSAPAWFGSVPLQGGHAGFSTTIGARSPEGRNLGRIARLQWVIPSAVREITVPVEFKNISTR